MRNQDLTSLMIQAVRQQDRDRYLCAMFAPSTVRHSVMTVLAFHAEVARIRDSVSEPLIAAIRFQWWRDALENDDTTAEANPIVDALRSLPFVQALKPHLLNILDVRQDDLDFQTFADAEDAEAWVVRTTKPLADALLCASVGTNEEGHNVVCAAMRAHGLLGVLRATHNALATGKALWQQTLMSDDKRGHIAREVVALANVAMQEAKEHQRQVPHDALFLLLPVLLVRQFIRILDRNNVEILDPNFYAPARVTLPFLWHALRKNI